MTPRSPRWVTDTTSRTNPQDPLCGTSRAIPGVALVYRARDPKPTGCDWQWSSQHPTSGAYSAWGWAKDEDSAKAVAEYAAEAMGHDIGVRS